MVPLEKEQHLGYKAFLISALRRMTVGIFFLFVSLVLTTFSNYFLQSIAKTSDIFKVPNTTTSTVLMIMTIVIFCGGVITCLVGILISWLEYTNYTYRLDEFNFLIKRGILDKKETLISYRQIQDVNIDRPIVYQLLGLSKLILKITSNDEQNGFVIVEIKIDALDKNVAEEVRNILEKKIGIQVVEDKFKK